YQQDTNSGLVTLDFVERLDLYAALGMSKTRADWRFTNTSTDLVHRIKLKTKDAFLWALGGRTILYEWCNLFLGVGGRYSSCEYAMSKVSTDGIGVTAAGSKMDWRQWQVNLDVSY